MKSSIGHTGFHYFLIEMQMCTSGISYIPLEVLNEIGDKWITHNIFRIQNNEFAMCGFYCTTFIEYMLAGKTLLDYTNFFPWIKRMTKYYKIILKINLAEEESLKFSLRQTDVTRNYFLGEIKSNDLIIWNYKICAITSGIKSYKSIIKEKKKHYKIVLLGKDKLNTIEVLISISHL